MAFDLEQDQVRKGRLGAFDPTRQHGFATEHGPGEQLGLGRVRPTPESSPSDRSASDSNLTRSLSKASSGGNMGGT